MGSLTISDLSPINGEPRIADITMRVALGVTTLQNIRRLIQSNADELLDHGALIQVMVTPGAGGRASKAYYLNQAQAYLVCAFADLTGTRAARKEIVTAFKAWWQGVGREARPSDPCKLTVFQSSPGEFVGPRDIERAPIAYGRRGPSRWTRYPEVLDFVTRAHRQMSLDRTTAVAAARFGADRSPSRSSIQRYWARLNAQNARSH